MAKSISSSLTKRLIAAGVIYVPSGLLWQRMQRVLNTFVRTIHQKKTKEVIFLSKHVCLNGTKQFCSEK